MSAQLRVVRGNADRNRSLGLARFLTDCAPDPVIVSIACERCGKFWHPRVHVDGNEATIDPRTLPGNCGCGAELDTVKTQHAVIGKARHYVDAFSRGRAS